MDNPYDHHQIMIQKKQIYIYDWRRVSQNNGSQSIMEGSMDYIHRLTKQGKGPVQDKIQETMCFPIKLTPGKQ